MKKIDDYEGLKENMHRLFFAEDVPSRFYTFLYLVRAKYYNPLQLLSDPDKRIQHMFIQSVVATKLCMSNSLINISSASKRKRMI